MSSRNKYLEGDLRRQAAVALAHNSNGTDRREKNQRPFQRLN